MRETEASSPKDAKEKVPKDLLAGISRWVELAKNLLTIGAILAGGYWFFEQRSNVPQVKLDQTVSQRLLSGSKDAWLIAVDVRATNVGKIKVSLANGLMELTQVNPIPGKALREEKLEDMVLEPGETDQALFRTYVIHDATKTVQMRSAYGVPGSNGLSWNLLSVFDVGSDSHPKETATTAPGPVK